MKPVLVVDSARVSPSVLIVGNIPSDKILRFIPNLEHTTVISFDDLHFNIKNLSPKVIISKLIDEDIDAIEIASLLREFGFSGSYKVLCDQSMNAKQIGREIQATAPTVHIEVLVIENLK